MPPRLEPLSTVWRKVFYCAEGTPVRLFVLTIFAPRFGRFWCRTYRETPLVVAIRAGQASGVELLTQHGAPLEGGRSNGKLIAADGRAPVGAREKMMARRCGRNKTIVFTLSLCLRAENLLDEYVRNLRSEPPFDFDLALTRVAGGPVRLFSRKIRAIESG